MTHVISGRSSSNFFTLSHQKRAREQEIPRSVFSKRSEQLAILTDTVSLGRNSTIAGTILKGQDAVARVAPAVGGLVIAGGALALFGGGTIVKNALSRVMTAYRRRNWESGLSNTTLATLGLSYSIAGAGMITAQSAAFASAVTTAAVGTSVFMGSAFGLYGILSVYAGLNLAITHSFRRNLNKKLLAASTELGQLTDTLEWLRNQLREGSNPEELNKKWDQFASRTSEACCRYVRGRLTPEFLEQVKNGVPSAVRHAKWIVQEVKRENAKQIAKNWLFMLISVLGIAALVFSVCFASGPFAPLLLAIGAGLWLLVDSNTLQEKFGNFLCGRSEIAK